MSVAGFKKQFYKASQMVSEKVGGAEGTKLDNDFKILERKADITSKALIEVMNKTSEYLQPNPATRARLNMLNTVSKMRGQESNPGYPQPETLLGESMTKYGREMGEDTGFGGALADVGDAMKRMGEVKDALDIDVKQNFIDPLQAVADKDIKDIQQQLKKLEGRRLDYDYKKKRQGKISEEEIRQALEKFEVSKEMAEMSMHNLLETDQVEQMSQLSSFVESLLQYHKQATQILEEVNDKLRERVNEVQSRPKREFQPKPRQQSFDYGEQSNGGYSPSSASPQVHSQAEPQCKALYSFEPENDGELGFNEGDIITLVSQIDENWLEGRLHGKTGYFPNNYVEVIVPLPN
ncbi:endophilin-A2-like isoform X2 [Kryptolebias marmoratus]|uniref:endophilin-A2-like isoform X2 n=1 Tax=Kryptolebias marmoratus TaxID=37003 RepID=UPI0007F8A5CA|nr:endophilin-A2-like isoform X2 [Kryptolebias marmoratus]